MSISAILAYGGQVTAIGLLIVFTGLFIIIGCIYLMSALFKMGRRAAENRARRKAERAAAKAEPAPVETPAPVQEVVSAPEQDDLVTDPQLIAVIAAAVAMAMEAAGEENTTGFVVRSIRRINNVPAWNRAGREEQVYSRM